MDTVTLEISHTVFGVIDDEEWPDDIRPAHTNGLVIPQARGALVCTGIHSGAIAVSVQVLDTAPAAPELRGWDEVVEVSFIAESNSVRVMALMEDAPDGLPSLVARGGSYRLRVHAKGRDTDPDGVADDPVEEYLLVTWPERVAGEQVFKTTDRVGEMNRLHATRATGFDSGAGALDDARYVEGDEDDDDPGVLFDDPEPA